MNNLKHLLVLLSAVCKTQKEYLEHVNTLALMMMGDKFGYDEGREYADVVAFKAEAKKVFKDSTRKGVVLKPKKSKLVVLKGGKGDIEQY